jgi:lanthionine synthetase-like protein
MLYEPERHEPLQVTPWDEARARATITAIVADAESAFHPERLWPVHPLDHTDMVSVPSYKSLYVGAAGVIWAIHHLQAVGAARLALDWVPRLATVYDAYREAPESIVVMPSYWLGEAGIFLIWWRMRPADAVADKLLEQVRSNLNHPSNELMLGASGTMLAALFMYEWTGEERWRLAVVESAKAVWAEWKYEPSPDCWLWTQQLFGQTGAHVGAVHGAAGNLSALLRGAFVFPDARRAELYQRCAELLQRTAIVDDVGVNWPQSVGQHREGRDALLVQWCHGSPGVVGSMRHFPSATDPQLETLLARAGELTWRAGPLTKGPGLCHGTAGNGYTFLELYRRTSDPVWLERARAFAMHAVEQYERMRVQYGQGRYSLATGDVGLAVYLWHCVQGAGGFPSVDVL